jgi:hypothetical protein
MVNFIDVDFLQDQLTKHRLNRAISDNNDQPLSVHGHHSRANLPHEA